MTNSNNIMPNAYSENINSIIKASIPVIDTSSYISPLLESTKVILDAFNESINLSLQPLIAQMNELNKQFASSTASIISNLILDSLEDIKSITSVSSEIISSISKTAFTQTIDTICNSLDEFDFNDEATTLVTEYKSDIVSIRNDLSSSKEINIHQWIATISAIIGIMLTILSNFDNSNEVLINQNTELIEIESLKLEKLESIDNSLKILLKSIE